VERRIKAVALRVAMTAGIDGLNQNGAAFVRRLRLHREKVSAALLVLEEPQPLDRVVRILTEEEIAAGARRIRARSHQPLEDLALYYLLLASGARPLEIARLEVRDYLTVEGDIRRCSAIREAVAINGRARPLYFGSERLDQALEAYLSDGSVNGMDAPSSHSMCNSGGVSPPLR
jgi:integrase